MINVSDEFKELMNERTDFTENAEVTLADGTVLNFDEDDFTVSNNSVTDSADSSSIPLGTAISRSIQMEIMNDDDRLSEYDFFGAKIRLYLKFALSSTTEKIEYGTFTVIVPETYGETVIITANDDMYKADKVYTTKISFPAKASAILEEICSLCDIPLLSTSFSHSDFIAQEKPSGDYTYRQIIGYIALIAGGNARINRQGKLEIISYDFSAIADIESPGSNVHKLANWNSLKVDTSDIVITGVQVTYTEDSEDKTILEGTEGYVISIEDNPLISGHEETVVSWLSDIFTGARFRKFEGDYIAYPLAEFMDYAVIEDRKGNEYGSFITDINFVFYGYTTLSNSAESTVRNASTYSDSSKAIVEARKLVEKEKTEREKAIEKLNEALSGESSGMYSTEEKQEDGSTIYYLHDKQTIEESQNVIKLTADAIGFSVDGGESYPYGFTIDGETITRLLYAEGINANYINSGALTIKDDDGNIIFSVDIDTKNAYINGDYVQIGGKSLEDRLTEIQNNSTALIISLDNDYQSISTDDEGNYTDFPDCKTTVTVMYGYEDVSADCSYSIAKSDGVEGTWDNDSRTYTVTGLSTDSGWVDITATYNVTFATTKRFRLQKVKSGSSYSLTPSVSTIKRMLDGTVAPAYIDFEASSYYSGTRGEYAGRFVIEESTDGETWTKKYESSADETSVHYSLYAFLADANGNYVADANGNFLAVQRLKEEIAIRCSLYLSNGTDTLVDREVVSIVDYAEAYSSEDIFNLLTDNGTVQGIYKVGNQIYINGEYIKANSITAEALNVEDLYALGATIGGWTISQKAIYKDITIDGTTYRVYFQPPNVTSGLDTWVLSCQTADDNGKFTGKSTFILFADGSAQFGNTKIGSDGSISFGKSKINADGSAQFGNTTIGSDGTISLTTSDGNTMSFSSAGLSFHTSSTLNVSDTLITTDLIKTGTVKYLKLEKYEE